MTSQGKKLLLLSTEDNVLVALNTLEAGIHLFSGNIEIEVKSRVAIGHKVACTDIQAGNNIFKYGVSIGTATTDITRGEHVHVHNLRSDYIETFVHKACVDKDRGN